MKTPLLLCVLVAVGAQYPGWWVPPEGASEKSPLTASPATIAQGKAFFATHCARCHGPEGQGGGPDSAYAADLTDDLRIELNTEGVLFYKIWKRAGGGDSAADASHAEGGSDQWLTRGAAARASTEPPLERRPAAAAAASLVAASADSTSSDTNPLSIGPGCPCCAGASPA